MWKYLLKRIFIFIPTIIAITLISFAISVNAPGDPVEQMMTGSSGDGGQNAERKATEKQYLEKRKELGLDLPIFYFSVSTLADCDTLYRIAKPNERKTLQRLISIYGNWDEIQAYRNTYTELEEVLYAVVPDSTGTEALITAKNILAEIKDNYQREELTYRFDTLDALLGTASFGANVRPFANRARTAFDAVVATATGWKTIFPAIHFYGFDNQYHRWLRNLLMFNFGTSYQDKRPITTKLPEALRWSIFINIFSILIAYLVSIPIGIYSATHKDSTTDRVSTSTLFVLYSLPSFWVATMLITFLCNPEYIQLFPSNGVQDTSHNANWALTQRLGDWIHHLILPTICYTYTSFAFLSRQMRVGMLETINQDFIRTARAKGLPERKVIWKHALRNSLIPIITLFAQIFPAMIGGSIILETIFTIPGMGYLSFQAIGARDYPVIISIFTLSGVLTLVGILVADVLYAVVDPRISFSKK